MNMDTGHIKLWSELSEQERDSGRWVKLGEGEYAKAITIEDHERKQRLSEIFNLDESRAVASINDELRRETDRRLREK